VTARVLRKNSIPGSRRRGRVPKYDKRRTAAAIIHHALYDEYALAPATPSVAKEFEKMQQRLHPPL